MKYGMKYFLLWGLLTISLTACSGTQDVSQLDSTGSTVPESFGTVELGSAPVEEAETTSLPAQEESMTVSTAEEETPQILDYTEQAVTGVLISMGLDHLEYSNTDDQFLWRAVGYLAGQIGVEQQLMTQEGEMGKITPETAKILAYGVNGNFSGELPVVTEEDPLIAKMEDGNYLVNLLNQAGLELVMTENRFSTEEDLVTESAELLQNGESLGTYEVTLTKYQGGQEGQQYFSYSVVGVTALS